jgi:RNA polymerase sigma-70 factor (ECF subfamily)
VADENAARAATEIEDDRLRLIFTCCHPAIDPDLQVPLTLREVCGLTTEEIAHAFLTSKATMAQRIVRGKAKIRDEQIPFVVPFLADLPERLDAVLSAIYLVFTEGYAATQGASLIRVDLTAEAIRLGRLLVELLPDPEARGLLALMLLHESRREARTSKDGEIILLEEQDRARWDYQLISEGTALVEQALRSDGLVCTRPGGHFGIMPRLAPPPRRTGTRLSRLSALRDIDSSPIVELNRAVAVAMRTDRKRLVLIDAILKRGDLVDYHRAHAAERSCAALRKMSDAKSSYERALSLARQEHERQFLTRRMSEV